MRVSTQGVEGSFHHQATTTWFKNQPVTILSKDSFDGVFSDLDAGTADKGVVAIENSIYGSITETYDLLEKWQFPVIGEIYLHIHQQLIGLPNTDLSAVTQVYSQSFALTQCTHFLDKQLPDAQRVEYHDTAASVAHVKALNDPSVVAIAGRNAALTYDLPILSEDIEDNKANSTRFLVIDPTGMPPSDANKATLSFTTDHTPGALSKVLSCFASAGINLTKLQSRPIVGDLWRYRFYIDVEAAGQRLHATIDHIRQTDVDITVLGEYVSGRTY